MKIKTFILLLMLSCFSIPIHAYTPLEKYCYATLTVENDLYIPGIEGFSVHLRKVGEETWAVERITQSNLFCSGSSSFNFYYLYDVRGINYQGSAMFLAQDGLLYLIRRTGPELPTNYDSQVGPKKISYEF